MKIIFALLVFVLGTVNIFSQETENKGFRRNMFSYYSGTAHFFFDGQTPIKFKHTYPQDVYPKPINRVLQSSLGCLYERRFNPNSSVYFELNHFYYKHNDFENNQLVDSGLENKGTMNNRNFIGLQLGYAKRNHLKEQIHFLCTIGFTYRYIDVNYAEPTFNPLLNQTRIRILKQVGNSYGLHGKVGLDYSPLNWLTFNTSMELNSFVLVPDNKNKINSRIDLSLRLGVGVNF